LGISAAILLGVIEFSPPQPRLVMEIVVIVLVLSLFLFHSLTVSIDEQYLRLRMGIGLIRIKFLISDIVKAYPVKNKWYSGWGIHLTGKGFLYNVSGFDAVEIVLSSGAIHRIGTDEPSALTQAINQSISFQHN
jgi:hypothetical protein